MKVTREQVEAVMRERGMTGDIVWRDNRASTYQQVYDWLMKHPERTLENFDRKEIKSKLGYSRIGLGNV